MSNLQQCSICGCDTEDMIYGYFGITPVAFCVWCQEGIHSYCDYIKVDE